MIITFLCKLVLGVISALLSLLPAWNVDTSAVTNGAGTFGGFLGVFDEYLPEHLIVACLGVLIGVKVALFAVRVLLTIWRLIPGKAT